jgi:hypothetical protein
MIQLVPTRPRVLVADDRSGVRERIVNQLEDRPCLGLFGLRVRGMPAALALGLSISCGGRSSVLG